MITCTHFCCRNRIGTSFILSYTNFVTRHSRLIPNLMVMMLKVHSHRWHMHNHISIMNHAERIRYLLCKIVSKCLISNPRLSIGINFWNYRESRVNVECCNDSKSASKTMTCYINRRISVL